MAKPRGTPPWVIIGCGCCLLVLLAIGGLVAAGILGRLGDQGIAEVTLVPTSVPLRQRYRIVRENRYGIATIHTWRKRDMANQQTSAHFIA